MAVLPQSGLCMIVLIRPVTYVWPLLIGLGGCSETSPLGTSQETEGSDPAWAAAKKLFSDWMFCCWLSCPTSWKEMSGFQIPGVFAPCSTGVHVSWVLLSQSGSVPWK